MSQYAINAKTWELFGEDAIMSEDELVSRGLEVKMAVADQVFGDIERRYSLSNQSMPVSATMMAPGLLLAPATGGMSVAAAFALTSIPTFVTTTAMVGSDRYYETLLNDLTPGTEKYKFDSPEDRFWHALNTAATRVLVRVGTGLAGVAGRLFKMSRLNPYLSTGYTVGTRADIGVRAFRGAAGLTLATGIGVLEESQAERFTGFFQDSTAP